MGKVSTAKEFGPEFVVGLTSHFSRVTFVVGGFVTTTRKPTNVRGSFAHLGELPNIQYIYLRIAVLSLASILLIRIQDLRTKSEFVRVLNSFNNPRRGVTPKMLGNLVTYGFLSLFPEWASVSKD
jgi:hypothetical protein